MGKHKRAERQGFQFHIVRLKVQITDTHDNTLFIFQFHIVRLKASSPFKVVSTLYAFQFHIVRLKVYASLLISCPFGYFNSI